MGKTKQNLRAVQIGTLGLALALLLALGHAWLTRPPTPSEALADLGGDFELVTAQGKTVTQRDFADRYLLVYFGFTFCPDICPTTLTLMSDALAQLRARAPKRAARIVPVFITIDPQRDTPAALAEYLSHFAPDFVGLTGTPAQIAHVARGYRVYYRKVIDESASDYLMDHSSILYLIAPDGYYAAHFDHHANAAAIAARLRRLVAP